MSSLPPLRERRPPGPLSWRARVAGLVVCAVAAAGLVAAGSGNPVPRPATTVAGVAEVAPPPPGRSWAPSPVVRDALSTVASVDDAQLILHTKGGPVTFLPGVNLGSTEPGHQPGELPSTAADYRSWFAAMGWLGIRVVRVYTIHPPAFYSELLRYNRAHPDRPLYLVQGVYLPDESYVAKGNLYDAGVTAAFSAELRDAVAAVHGGLRREVSAGRAAGVWTADASPWLVAWIAGVEWDPNATAASDTLNAAAPGFSGRYFGSTVDASPTERWIAARLDELATAQAGSGRSMPIAFVNWPTTDPLRHPEEPLPTEDLVGVDANHVRATGSWPGGTFASYHAYPYYPDFQRHEPALQTFVHGGRADPYAGYLDALRRHHREAGLPTLVSEFGVPSSIGLAHYGPLGRDQGGHSEAEAMRVDAELLTLIQDVGMAGGFVFAWTDEWFKFTWNTIGHQMPADRRPLWHDPLTNEQHFGLVATDPTGAANPDPVTLDGATARVDEAYLHLRVPVGPAGSVRSVTLGFDTLPGPRLEAAFAFDLGTHAGESWIRSELDPVGLDYVAPAGVRPKPRFGWTRYQLNTNRDLVVPSTGERLPAEFQDVGVLRYGRPETDDRALWYLDGSDLVVRVPWALAGFADPSSRAVLVPQGRAATTVTVAGVGLTISRDGVEHVAGTVTWQDWQRVGFTERLKPDARRVRDAMVATATRGEA
jgi:hypothetical protein